MSTNLQQVLEVCTCLEIKFVKSATTMNPDPEEGVSPKPDYSIDGSHDRTSD